MKQPICIEMIIGETRIILTRKNVFMICPDGYFDYKGDSFPPLVTRTYYDYLRNEGWFDLVDEKKLQYILTDQSTHKEMVRQSLIKQLKKRKKQ